METYLFFIVIFLFSLIAFNFIFEGQDLGKVSENAPYVVAKVMTIASGFMMFIVSMIMGVPILRDFDHSMESLVFVNPITKWEYLTGRFLGSFLVLILIFAALPLGMIIGEMMPWRESAELLEFNIWSYLHPFVLLVIPSLLIGGTVFFISGTLSRKMIVVYTQGLVFLLLTILTIAIKDPFLSSVLEPLSYAAIDEVTRYWTSEDLNRSLIPIAGVLLVNRLFWLMIGFIVFAIGYKMFSFNVVKDQKGLVKKEIAEVPIYLGTVPDFTPELEARMHFKQLFHKGIFHFNMLLKEASFWAIIGSGAVIIMVNSINLGTEYGVDSYPTTYLILEELKEMALYFFLIILVFYPGEMIWKERTLRIDGLIDSSPVTDAILVGGKLIGLFLAYGFLLSMLMSAGIAFQLLSGYFEFNLEVYFVSLVLELLPFLILFTILAFFTQLICSSKYAGNLLFVVLFICLMAMGVFGLGHGLYRYGGIGLRDYSDMNGYGHFLTPFLLFRVYWITFGLMLFVHSVMMRRRGEDRSLWQRWKDGKDRWTPGLKRLTMGAAAIFFALGVFLSYHTLYLNPSYSNKAKKAFRAGYEKTLEHLEYLPQPKIVEVNLNIDLYPKERNYKIKGIYILKNETSREITEVHVQAVLSGDDELTHTSFSTATKPDDQYQEYNYAVYQLEQALLPGDSITMFFEQEFISKGLRENDNGVFMVENGTFFDNDRLPSLGYNQNYELEDDKERLNRGLSASTGMAEQSDVRELANGRSGDDGSWIRFEMLISTDVDQVAVAPGVLVKDSVSNDKRYFHYKMKEPMINFYSIVSARYQVVRDQWSNQLDVSSPKIDLEIYHHKGHEYNLDRMMNGMKSSLSYFSEHFSRYRYEVLRIAEYPRYRKFAQSFPTTIPFSEGLGFILDIDDATDVDIPFYITAHEVAHQWWGLNLVAANVKGKNFILETLAQYSALMVLKASYGEEKVLQFLDIQKRQYDEKRRGDHEDEKPLMLLEKEEYLYYNKGALAMYELQLGIGEGTVNRALQRFLKDWNIMDGPLSEARFPTSADLMEYFKSDVVESQRGFIKELFEEVWDVGNCYESVN